MTIERTLWGPGPEVTQNGHLGHGRPIRSSAAEVQVAATSPAAMTDSVTCTLTKFVSEPSPSSSTTTGTDDCPRRRAPCESRVLRLPPPPNRPPVFRCLSSGKWWTCGARVFGANRYPTHRSRAPALKPDRQRRHAPAQEAGRRRAQKEKSERLLVRLTLPTLHHLPGRHRH